MKSRPLFLMLLVGFVCAAGEVLPIAINKDRVPDWNLPKTAGENWRFYPVEWQTKPVGEIEADSSFDFEATMIIGDYKFAKPLFDTGQYSRFDSMAQYHFQGGIVFGFHSELRQYRLQFSVKEKCVALWKTPNNFLAVADCAIEKDKPFTISLLRTSAVIVKVNGKEVLRVRDAIDPIDGGKLMIGASHALVDAYNIKFTSPINHTGAEREAEHKSTFNVREWCGYRWVFDGQEPIARIAEGKDGKPWSWHPVGLYEMKLRPGARPVIYAPTNFHGGGKWPEKPFEIVEVKPDRVKLRSFILKKKKEGDDASVRTVTDVTISYAADGDTYVYDMDSRMEYLQDARSVLEIFDPFPYGCCRPAHSETKPYDGRYTHIVVRGDDNKLYKRPLNHFARPVLLTLSKTDPMVAYLGETDVNPVYEIIGESRRHQYHASMCMVLQDHHVQRHNWPKTEKKGTKHHDQWRILSVHGKKAKKMLASAEWHPAWKPQVNRKTALFIPSGSTFSGDQVVSVVKPCGTQAFDPYGSYTIDPEVGHNDKGSLRFDAKDGGRSVKTRGGLAAFGKALEAGTYAVKLYVKCKDFDGKFSVGTDYPKKQRKTIAAVTGTTAEWIPAEITIDVTPETPYVVLKFGIGAERGKSKGSVWVDDVSLLPAKR